MNMKGLTRRFSWRAAVVAVASVAAATLISADAGVGQPTLLTGVTANYPVIEFDGSQASKITYDSTTGLLSFDALAVFLDFGTPAGQTEKDYVLNIVSDVTPSTKSQCPAGDGSHPQFFATDLNGVGHCMLESTYGSFTARTNVIAAKWGTTVLPNIPVVVDGIADACGNNGVDFEDLCVKGAVLRCVDGPQPMSALGCNLNNTYQLLYYDPSKPLLTAKRTLSGGFANQTYAQGLALIPPVQQVNGAGFAYDKFEMVMQVTGGGLAPLYTASNAGMSGDPRRTIVVASTGLLGLAPLNDTRPPFVDWTQSFAEVLEGTAAAANASRFLPPVDSCNGRITGVVLNAVTSGGIADTTVTVSGVPLQTPEARTTGADGSYVVASSVSPSHTTGLCAGTYTVSAAPPLGYVDAANDGFPSSVQVVLVNTGGNDSSSQVNFKFYPSVSTDFVTYSQNEWGAKPNLRAQNAGYLLQTFYIVPYGTGSVVIGLPGGKTVTMTGPVPVQNFLPQQGRPIPLDFSYVDPVTMPWHRRPHLKLGSLAGETLALQLNVDFSAASLTRFGLGNLYVKTGKLKNKTVSQVLALANSVLGGGPLPAGLKYDDVEDAAEMINMNFRGGVNRGNLSPNPVP